MLGPFDIALEPVRSEFAGTRSAHRSHGLDGLLAVRFLIVLPALAVVSHVQCSLPFRILRGRPDRALTGMADLSMDAADGHHHGAGGARVVGTLDESFDHIVAGGDLPAGPDADPIPQCRAD